MPSPKTDRSERYTYADYLTWNGGERWELMDGAPYLLASPIPEHQQTLVQLSAEFAMHLRGKGCRAYINGYGTRACIRIGIGPNVDPQTCEGPCP